MGNVNFNTDVRKNVNIQKTVNVDVDKNVNTNVNLNGSLASAEASADAVGGSGGGQTGSRRVVPFTPDDLSTGQQVIANPNPASGFDDPASSMIVVPGADTDFDNQLERTLLGDVLSDQGQGVLSVEVVQSGRLTFAQDDGTFSNSYARWDLPDGAEPFATLGNADIVANPEDYLFQFNDISFNPGTAADGSAATVRVSFIVEDAAGERAITTVALVPGEDGQGFTEADDVDIVASFAGFINQDIADTVTPGTFIDQAPDNNAGIVFIGTDANDNVDLSDLASFQVLLEDRPGQAIEGNDFSSADFFAFNTTPGFVEIPSVSGTDAATDLEWTNVVVRERPFNIAETETFAQVTPEGSFAFSDSLAAFSGSIADEFLL